MARLGDGSGKSLEQLAEYLLSCMPGCRTARRLTSNSTDYDVVCAMEGLESDFRSELGRYFICECKDWAEPADFTSFAKFCRVLDSVKARFGILFSKHGISGTGRRQDADLEQLKVFQDRGMVIVVFTEEDLKRVIEGRWDREFADSPLEESGFEPLVPLATEMLIELARGITNPTRMLAVGEISPYCSKRVVGAPTRALPFPFLEPPVMARYTQFDP
jgi:hypothetical protein